MPYFRAEPSSPPSHAPAASPPLAGDLAGKKVALGYKPLFVALSILGAIGLLAAASGLGVHQGWWSVSHLSHLGQPTLLITVIGAGGAGAILLTIGTIGLIAGRCNHAPKKKTPTTPYIPGAPGRYEAKNEELAPLKATFAAIQSGKLLQKPAQTESLPTDRAGFLKDPTWETPPPYIAHSDFVPLNVVEHLMKNKKDSAIGVKYKKRDLITNMEGALHTFVTPICMINMTGDYMWKGGHSANLFPKGQMRQVVMSAAIQPDFEDQQVMLQVVALRDEVCMGEPLTTINIPSQLDKQDDKKRAAYDEALRKHMIYHLTHDRSLPAKNSVLKLDTKGAIDLLELEIYSANKPSLVDLYATIQGHVISLEAYFNIYVHQLRNELTALEALLPQGYIYTINPPSIFVKELGGNATLGNRLQILAFKKLASEMTFKHLQHISVNDYADEAFVKLLNGVVPVQVSSTKEDPPISLKWAEVIHNNSDAFGQNIETEAMSSLDGVIGSISDAACCLKRDRPDLLTHVRSISH